MRSPSEVMSLNTLGGTGGIDFEPRRVIIAGFTGRDRDEVERHVEELARAGVPRPATVPAFYDVSPALLTTDTTIVVSSPASTGEAEAVLLGAHGRWYVAVGSDHTARDLERKDIALSKRACPKVLGLDVVAYDELAADWDALRLESWTGAERSGLQDGHLAQLIHPRDLLRALELDLDEPEDGLALFLGTVPLATGDFVVSDSYAMSLSTPNGCVELALQYAVTLDEGRTS
jgi:hypothetical protein